MRRSVQSIGRTASLSLLLAAAASCAGGGAPTGGGDLAMCPGGLVCDGVCVDPQDDDRHCGACGKACDAGLACVAGTCTLRCPGGQTACVEQKLCVDLKVDRNHCGGCGSVCPAGKVCSVGACALSCLQGTTECAGRCVNVDSDNGHCGGCDKACAPGSVCSLGKCAPTCADGYASCGGGCADLGKDSGNCGACGSMCPPGLKCSNGACLVSCQQGLVECGGVCANTRTDRAHCGGCGIACLDGEACVMGACAPTCGGGLLTCAGRCVDPKNDPAHCGACGAPCGPGSACVDGRCAPACVAPLSICGPVCADTRFDPSNCARCGNVCPPPPNASAACLGGRCGVGACSAGFIDCDGSAANGCETNIASDVVNCGGCGKVCAAVAFGLPGCAAGVCGIGSCSPGRKDCDALANTGCEVDTLVDVKNCGACGMDCPAPPNGSAACGGGQCRIASCAAGFADCDGVFGNGCEVDLRTDLANCGACGAACPPGVGGAVSCAAGACRIQCDFGRGDCDGILANGCEANLINDGANCGRCGRACGDLPNGVGVCNVGLCAVQMCNAGFGDCDADASNGCEASFASDASHCGGCGMACGNGQQCTGGACVSPCGNPGGGLLTADNGTGRGVRYCYNQGDSTEARGQKACESHFGLGACCVIPGGYSGRQYGRCGADGGPGTVHFHPDSWPAGHCGPQYRVGDVVSPGWCGTVLGNFLN